VRERIVVEAAAHGLDRAQAHLQDTRVLFYLRIVLF
jgi:hypothetical protein